MLFEETSIGSVKMEDVVSYAKRLRKRRLIPGSLVSTPLAEFTSWKGALVGHEAFTSFNKWAYDSPRRNGGKSCWRGSPTR